MSAAAGVDLVASALQRQRGWGLEALDRGPVCMLAGGPIDHPMLNRVVVSEPLDDLGLRRAVDPALAWLRSHGATRYLVQLASAAPAGWLEQHCLVPFRRWVRLERDARPPQASSTRFDIVRVGPARAAEAGRIAAVANGLPESAGEVIACAVGRPQWHAYAALDDDAIVAVGMLYLDGDQGYLGMAGTLPAHRGGGAQRALLARRIQVGIDLGCRAFTAETGEAVAGEPQHSYRNLCRHGFEPAATIHNYVPAA